MRIKGRKRVGSTPTCRGIGNQHMPLLFKWALKDGKDFNRKTFKVLRKTGLKKIGKACWRKK